MASKIFTSDQIIIQDLVLILTNTLAMQTVLKAEIILVHLLYTKKFQNTLSVNWDLS